MKNIIAGALSLFSVFAQALEIGATLPNIKVKDQSGKEFTLDTLKGKWVLFYFYPKDDTPGCTKQACMLRDDFKKYKDAGIVVYGVSNQSTESHKKFISKYKLPFDLIADDEGELGKALGIEKVLGFYKRQTVLVDPEMKLAHKFVDVDPATHSDLVMEKFQELSKK